MKTIEKIPMSKLLSQEVPVNVEFDNKTKKITGIYVSKKYYESNGATKSEEQEVRISFQ